MRDAPRVDAHLLPLRQAGVHRRDLIRGQQHQRRLWNRWALGAGRRRWAIPRPGRALRSTPSCVSARRASSVARRSSPLHRSSSCSGLRGRCHWQQRPSRRRPRGARSQGSSYGGYESEQEEGRGALRRPAQSHLPRQERPYGFVTGGSSRHELPTIFTFEAHICPRFTMQLSLYSTLTVPWKLGCHLPQQSFRGRCSRRSLVDRTIGVENTVVPRIVLRALEVQVRHGGTRSRALEQQDDARLGLRVDLGLSELQRARNCRLDDCQAADSPLVGSRNRLTGLAKALLIALGPVK